jgi:hypothetical protein
VRDDATLLDGAFPASDALQNAEPTLEGIERFDSHQVRRRLSVLSDEHGILVSFEVGNDFGGLALEGRDEFSSHEVAL